MNGLEGITVSRWVYGTLTADPTLQDLLGGAQGIGKRVWEGVAPDDTAYPFLTYTIMEPRDVKVVGQVQVFARVQFMLKVIGKGASYTPLVPVYKRAHDLVETRTNQPVQDGLVISSHRVSGIQYPERASGVEYRHLGGLYETESQ